MRLPIPLWPVGQMIPVLLKAYSTVMVPNLPSLLLDLPCRPSCRAGFPGRMLVPRLVLRPAPSDSGADPEPLVVPLSHLDRPVAASWVAVVARATSIHVRLGCSPFVRPMIDCYYSDIG